MIVFYGVLLNTSICELVSLLMNWQECVKGNFRGLKKLEEVWNNHWKRGILIEYSKIEGTIKDFGDIEDSKLIFVYYAVFLSGPCKLVIQRPLTSDVKFILEASEKLTEITLKWLRQDWNSGWRWHWNSNWPELIRLLIKILQSVFLYLFWWVHK